MRWPRRWRCVNLRAQRGHLERTWESPDSTSTAWVKDEDLESVHVWTPVGQLPGLAGELTVQLLPGDVVNYGDCTEHPGKKFRPPRGARLAVDPG